MMYEGADRFRNPPAIRSIKKGAAMTRLLTLMLVLAVAAAAQAQVNHPYNEVGIYTVERPDGCEGAQVDIPAMTQVTCYVVLTNPYNESLGRPITTIGAVEFALGLSSGVVLMGAQVPWTAVGFPPLPPDYVLSGQVPVVDGFFTIMVLTLMPTTANPAFVHLLPVQDTPQTIAGEMAVFDFDDGYSANVMHPVSGSADVPVFAINWDGDLSFCETVPDETASFGGVKALYR